MVDTIADYLHHATYQIGNDKFVHADKILQKMEDSGMLPPVRKKPVTSEEVIEYAYAPEWRLLRKWDKENE